MPTYSFKDTNTGEEFDKFMKMSERDDFLKDNPHVQPMLSAPSIVSGVSTSTQHRVPDGFKEVLSKVAEAHPASVVGDRYGKRSSKEIKTKQLVDKHTGIKT